MLGLAEPDTKVWVEHIPNPARKLKYSWRLVEHNTGHFTGIDTGSANTIVRDALEARAIAGLDRYSELRSEVKYGEKSRVDFLLSGEGGDTYVEVKSVTLSRRTGIAEFPDSVTERGTRHLAELSRMVQGGYRAVMLYLVQRTDCAQFDLAADIDPAYAAAFRQARAAGVLAMALQCEISPAGTSVSGLMPCTGHAQ